MSLSAQDKKNSTLRRDPTTGRRQWVGARAVRNGTKPAGLVTAIGTAGDGKLKKHKKRILLRGLASLDKRGPVARVYQEMRAALTDQYGGPEAITPAQEMLIEMFCRGKTYLNHVDVTLHELARLTNATRRKAVPLLMERFSLAKILSGQLEQLGLERRGRTRSLAEDLAASPELLTRDGMPISEQEDKA
jgi:hypothetical protein